MMRYRRLRALFVVIALCWLFFHKPANFTYFISFDEAQIQEHYTPKDLINFYQRLHKKKWRLLKRLYKTHLAGRKKCHKKERIPKIIHQIWLGSPLPEQYKKMQKTWLDHHPNWEYHLWTDENVQYLYLQNRPLYEAATNLGQKSDILRYEILYQFGGLYVDTDFECLKPFDVLNETCDFYAGIIDHIKSPQICNALIASTPGHPIIDKCIKKLRGAKISQTPEQQTGPAFFTRCFFETAKKKGGKINVILPATFFYPLPWHQKDSLNISNWIQDNSFAIHYWDS